MAAGNLDEDALYTEIKAFANPGGSRNDTVNKLSDLPHHTNDNILTENGASLIEAQNNGSKDSSNSEHTTAECGGFGSNHASISSGAVKISHTYVNNIYPEESDLPDTPHIVAEDEHEYDSESSEDTIVGEDDSLDIDDDDEDAQSTSFNLSKISRKSLQKESVHGEKYEEEDCSEDDMEEEDDEEPSEKPESAENKTGSNVERGKKPESVNVYNKAGSNRKKGKKSSSPVENADSKFAKKPYMCGVCNKFFKWDSDLQNHLRVHTGEKPFECEQCPLTFRQNSHLKRHMHLYHPNDLEYKCHLCGEAFYSKIVYNRHMKTHLGKNMFKCEICFKSFPKPFILQRHMIKHSNMKPFECGFCHKKFRQPHYFKIHVQNHQTSKEFECGICKKFFPLSHMLTRHMRSHTGERPYQCQICGMSFVQSGNLKHHMQWHSGDKPFQCDICEKTFTNKRNLDYHRSKHPLQKIYECKFCKIVFDRDTEHLQHVVFHTSQNRGHLKITPENYDKIYRCDVCEQDFTERSELHEHLLNVHTEVNIKPKSLKCDICENWFTNENERADHVSRVHPESGGRPYKCSLCPYSFAREQHLNDHLRTHTGEKPFECDLCDKKFARATNLNRHKKLCHGVDVINDSRKEGTTPRRKAPKRNQHSKDMFKAAAEFQKDEISKFVADALLAHKSEGSSIESSSTHVDNLQFYGDILAAHNLDGFPNSTWPQDSTKSVSDSADTQCGEESKPSVFKVEHLSDDILAGHNLDSLHNSSSSFPQDSTKSISDVADIQCKEEIKSSLPMESNS